MHDNLFLNGLCFEGTFVGAEGLGNMDYAVNLKVKRIEGGFGYLCSVG